MNTFTLELTRDEVIALSRAIQNEVKELHWASSKDDLYTMAHLMKVVAKLPEPEELDIEVEQ